MQSSSDILLKKLEPLREEIDKNYSCLTLEERKIAFSQAIDILIEKNDISSASSALVKSKVKTYYLYELKKLFKTHTTLLGINNNLLEYTNSFFKTSKINETQLIKYANSLLFFFPNISYQEYSYILNNTKVSDFIKQAICKDNSLNKKEAERLKNTNFYPLLAIYCQNNNISLEEDFLEEDIKENTTDDFLPNDAFNDYMQQIPRKVLTLAEEKYYFKLIALGDEEAKKYVIEHNLKLVVSIAKKYTTDKSLLQDLIQEGNIGLMKAVDRFNLDMGSKFSTYAAWWIRQAINNALINNARMIRIPPYFMGEINRYQRIKRKLSNELGIDPSNDLIAKEMNITPEDVAEIIKASTTVISYNIEVGNNEDKETKELVDFIEDEETDIENAYLSQDLQERMDKYLNILTERERDVVINRFGFYNRKELTLEEIGKRLNITRERVRQIEKDALEKLFYNKDVRKAAVYLDFPVSFEKEEKYTLRSQFGAPKKYLFEVIKLLDSSEQAYLQKMFGENLDKKAIIVNTEEYDKITTKIRVMLRAYVKPKNISITKNSLSEILNISEDLLLALISKLDDYDKKIIYQKYADLKLPPVKELPLPLENYFNKVIVKNLLELKKETAKVYMKKH